MEWFVGWIWSISRFSFTLNFNSCINWMMVERKAEKFTLILYHAREDSRKASWATVEHFFFEKSLNMRCCDWKWLGDTPLVFRVKNISSSTFWKNFIYFLVGYTRGTFHTGKWLNAEIWNYIWLVWAVGTCSFLTIPS